MRMTERFLRDAEIGAVAAGFGPGAEVDVIGSSGRVVTTVTIQDDGSTPWFDGGSEPILCLRSRKGLEVPFASRSMQPGDRIDLSPVTFRLSPA